MTVGWIAVIFSWTDLEISNGNAFNVFEKQSHLVYYKRLVTMVLKGYICRYSPLIPF